MELAWTPGKFLYIADTLSRAKVSEKVDGILEGEIKAQVNMVYQALPVSQGYLDRIAEETEKDEVVEAVQKCL